MKAIEVKNSIIESFHENNNPHAFLISTNNLDTCYKDLVDIVRIINCTNTGDVDCDCQSCKLISHNNCPDFITVEPDVKEIKISSVETIMNSFITKPLVSKYQVYIIKEADKLNISAANKILKFLEEPNEGVIAFLLSNNISNILPTIRSRCTLFNFNYDFNNLLSILDITEDIFEKYYNDAMQIIFHLENDKKYELMMFFKEISKKDRNDLIATFNIVSKIYTIKFENILHGCYNNFDFTEQIIDSILVDNELIISSRIKNINKVIELFNKNGNRDLILSRLTVVWE